MAYLQWMLIISMRVMQLPPCMRIDFLTISCECRVFLEIERQTSYAYSNDPNLVVTFEE